MKYIRTKDGVYEIDYQRGNGDYISMIGFYIPQTMVTKQADTIEELCDEFIILDKDLNHRHIVTGSKGFMPSKDYELYGAIWTEWGLKYVAKLNNKGELDLL